MRDEVARRALASVRLRVREISAHIRALEKEMERLAAMYDTIQTTLDERE